MTRASQGPVPEEIPLELLGRFRPVRELGRGGCGIVFEVEDRVDPGPPKALKVVRRRRGDARADLLRREFDVLRKLRHPGLVRVHDFGEDRAARLLWFTSDYVPGPDLYEASAAWTPFEIEEALRALAETLQFLHERGILHNDLKPANIRVPGRPGSALLLDFGLASQLAGGPLASGTPPYMAPERLRGGRPSVRADLYGLGAVVYRCAVRQRPFEGDEAAEILASIAGGLVAPRLLRPDLPHYLDALLARLLHRDPSGRPVSATGLLAELEGARGLRDPPTPSTNPLPGPPLFEREEILTELRSACSDTLRGAPAARASSGASSDPGAGGGISLPIRALVVGEPGIGKSRLLAELRQTLELEGASVIALGGRRGAVRAWDLASRIVKSLAALRTETHLRASLARLVDDRPGDGEGAVGEVAEGLVAALAESAAASPLLLLLDDLGWADEPSVSAVLGLARASPPIFRLALVATARDEPDARPLVERWQGAGLPIRQLGGLSERAQRALLVSLFSGGQLGDRLVSEAVVQAAGNPLALEEIARTWIESGVVRKAGGGWRISDGARSLPGGAPRELIAARLRALPAPDRELVETVALAAHALPWDVAVRLDPEAAQRLAALKRRHLLVQTPDGVDVRHPLLREAALGALGEEEARPLHRRLVAALGASGAGSDDLWLHLLRGSDLARGLPAALAAGQRAEALEDFHAGRAILGEALRVAEATPDALGPADHLRLRVSLAACLDETGDQAGARRLLEDALPRAAPEETARLLVLLGRVLYRSGDAAAAEAVLRRAEESGPAPLLAIEATIWRAEALMLGGRWEEAPAICRARLASTPDADGLGGAAASALLARMHMTAGLIEETAVGLAPATPRFEAALALAERSGLARLRAKVRMHRAFHRAQAGDVVPALAELADVERTLSAGGSIVRSLEVSLFQGQVLHHHGQSESAVARLEAVAAGGGTANLPMTALGLLTDLLGDQADPRAIDWAIDLCRLARQGRPLFALPEALCGGLRAAVWLGERGAPEIEKMLEELSNRPAAPMDRPSLSSAKAMSALGAGDFERAAGLLDEACQLARPFGLLALPRHRFHLAHALALAGRAAGALAAADEAATGFAALGNAVEQARAVCLRRGIEAGHVGTTRGTDFMARAIESGRPATADGPTTVVERVAAACGATAVWLLTGSGRSVVARAGPCAAVAPLAWGQAIDAALGGAVVRRPGVGVTLPLELEGQVCALAVEGRAWPQAFPAEAATAAELALARVLDLLQRTQLETDLANARKALSDVRTPAAARPIRSDDNTLATVRGPLAARGESRLLELTLGSIEVRHAFADIVGRSRAMRRALGVIDRAVALDTPVLVTGETGTGKELVARALHQLGPRAARAFVAVNCAAIPPTIAESELFGHVPGAFTGAGRIRHHGYFEQASGGTLFLDEVGELDLGTQAKLLRALEEGKVRPVGAEREVEADVRVVTATNRDLRRAVDEGRFRVDLLYRLAVIEVRLPPLRERADDIPALIKHLLREIVDPPPALAPEAVDALCAHSWPGNVRELANELERAAAFCGGGPILLQHLSPAVRVARATSPASSSGDARSLRGAVDALERKMIAEALRSASGQKAAAARALGLTRMGLRLKMRRLGLAAVPVRRRGTRSN